MTGCYVNVSDSLQGAPGLILKGQFGYTHRQLARLLSGRTALSVAISNEMRMMRVMSPPIDADLWALIADKYPYPHCCS